jgi:hypothetical protein
MHRALFPDSAELDRSERGGDLSMLFHVAPASSQVENGIADECPSVFSKHRIPKIGVAAQLDRRAERGSHDSFNSTKQLLNSEVMLLQSTIQNKEVLLTNIREQMLELRLKLEQQSAEKQSLKNQVAEMKESTARAAEQHAIEIQSYLAKVLDAEEKTLQANSAIDLAANVHKAAESAQRAASSARFENSAFKRDKDRLIHLLSLFEPAKALAIQLQQYPSHYFPLPGIGSSAISSITKAQLTSASSFVKPLVSKKMTAESTFWMSSKIAKVVLGWSAENNIDERISLPLVAQLDKLWIDSAKREKEFASVSRLRKNRTAASPMEHFKEDRPLTSRKFKIAKRDKQANISYPSTPAHEQMINDSATSLNAWGTLLQSGMSRLRMKSHTEGEQDSRVLHSETTYYPESHVSYMQTPKCVDHRIASPVASFQSFLKCEERSHKKHDFVSSELLESLKQEMLLASNLSAGKSSPLLSQYLSPTAPLEKAGELALRNTSLKISLLDA